MIEALVASQEEIRLHRELLEDRIRHRTEGTGTGYAQRS